MPISIHAAGVEIAGSTTSANAALPASSYKYIRVVNGTNGIAYCNAGSSTIAATAANSGVAPNSTDYFERLDPSADAYGAVILSAGATAGKVSMTPVGTTYE